AVVRVSVDARGSLGGRPVRPRARAQPVVSARAADAGAATGGRAMAPLSARRSVRTGVAITAIAVIATIVAIAIDPRRGLLGYLAGYAVVSTTAMGALVLLLIGYATNARWLATVRRLHEAIVSVFPLLAILFVPIVAGMA